VLDPIITKKILEASCPEDVFGTIAGDKLEAIRAIYRQIAKVVHPDSHQGTPHAKAAQEAFMKLTQLKTDADSKIKANTYGKRSVVAPGKGSLDPIEVTVRSRKFIVSDLLYKGDLADLYRCQVGGQEALFKIVNEVANNDLLENEARVLTHLYPPSAKDEKFHRYITKPVDSFILKGKTHRRVNVVTWAKEFRPLSEVLTVYPNGIDFRDAVWMYKRILAGLGFVHANEVVHGAILPPHVLIHTVNHGAKLVDWCYAVKGDGRIRAISPAFRDFYPPEVFDKKPATASTDLYMAAKCAVALMGGDVKTGAFPSTVPAPIQTFFKASLQSAPSKRPTHAWDLHESFDELLKRTVGKRAYRPFDLP
jgi:serine/threonine protein kinase